jgi:polyisoprenoid-binding protein YceI
VTPDITLRETVIDHAPARPRRGPAARLARRGALSLLVVALTAACGQAAAPAAQPGGQAGATAPAAVSAANTPAAGAAATAPTAPSGAAATPAAPAVAVPAGALHFRIVPNESTATFRVREQLAGRELPNDAVGSTGAVSGQIVLRPDGTIVGDTSKIVVDLRQLQTDSGQRDRFIKSNTLTTDQFPTAEFTPSRAEGLPNPLPASGEYAFKLVGPMTVRGVQKEVTWDVTAQRNGNSLVGEARTALKFGDFNLSQPRVPLVLSITDDIRLEVSLVANQAAA